LTEQWKHGNNEGGLQTVSSKKKEEKGRKGLLKKTKVE
jgi:hypothetical protein